MGATLECWPSDTIRTTTPSTFVLTMQNFTRYIIQDIIQVIIQDIIQDIIKDIILDIIQDIIQDII